MSATRIYLDYNASAPLIDEAREAVITALHLVGNPSSVHQEGRSARIVIESARRDVAALVNARSDHVVFTSGATEAASTLLTPHYMMGRTPLCFSGLYVGATEHPCVLAGGQFAFENLNIIPVGSNGLIEITRLKDILKAHDKSAGLPLVAVQMANNETGIIQPIAEIASIVKQVGGFLVVDAVQAAGRILLDISKLRADYLILSSHKIGGPKSVGAIISCSDFIMPRALIRGGGQEKGHRAGTEALSMIAGFGAAAKVAVQRIRLGGWSGKTRDLLEKRIRHLIPDIMIYGFDVSRLPNTTFFSFSDMKAETVQIAFDLAGIALSAGSACSSGKVGPSHVLAAMGYENTFGAIRVSTRPDTGEEEIKRFLEVLSTLIERFHKTGTNHHS